MKTVLTTVLILLTQIIPVVLQAQITPKKVEVAQKEPDAVQKLIDEIDKMNIKKFNQLYGRLANINGISALLATSATSFLYPFEVMKFRMQCKIFIFL